MSGYLKLGLWLFVPAAVVAGVNLWAMRAFPRQWGGPNIGGGMIQLLAYGVMLAGVVLVVVSVAGRRGRSRR